MFTVPLKFYSDVPSMPELGVENMTPERVISLTVQERAGSAGKSEGAHSRGTTIEASCRPCETAEERA
jgi:hypothetical protein